MDGDDDDNNVGNDDDDDDDDNVGNYDVNNKKGNDDYFNAYIENGDSIDNAVNGDDNYD